MSCKLFESSHNFTFSYSSRSVNTEIQKNLEMYSQIIKGEDTFA